MDGIRLAELTRIGEGREAEVFALDDRRVLRLVRTPELGPRLDHEQAAMVAARRAGAPVPEVFERVEVDGRPGLVVERLGTRNLLLEIGERPWRVFAIARELATLHARIHEVRAPAELPSVHERTRGRLESPLVPPDVGARALEVLATLPEGDRLCHGDFHPANVLVAADGGARVIDWTAASRGDPAADIARSRLIIRHGAVGPDATLTVRALSRIGRRVLWHGYVAGYPTNRAKVDAWFGVMAAARLAEDIPEERTMVLRIASRELAGSVA